jgi:hypothetical protein
MQRDVGAVPEAIASYRRCLELDEHNRHAGGHQHYCKKDDH